MAFGKAQDAKHSIQSKDSSFATLAPWRFKSLPPDSISSLTVTAVGLAIEETEAAPDRRHLGG